MSTFYPRGGGPGLVQEYLSVSTVYFFPCYLTGWRFCETLLQIACARKKRFNILHLHNTYFENALKAVYSTYSHREKKCLCNPGPTLWDITSAFHEKTLGVKDTPRSFGSQRIQSPKDERKHRPCIRRPLFSSPVMLPRYFIKLPLNVLVDPMVPNSLQLAQPKTHITASHPFHSSRH